MGCPCKIVIGDLYKSSDMQQPFFFVWAEFFIDCTKPNKDGKELKDVFIAEDFGFYDFYKCNKFLEIDSYDLTDKVVEFGSTLHYWTYEFFDNYIERIGHGDYFGNDIDKLMYNIIDFENLNWTEGTLRIIDRISVDEQNNYLILKCITGGASERWFISYDAIDWAKSPQKQENDNEDFFEFYLK